MAYSFYRSLTVDHTKVPSDQTDFPVLVSVTDVTLKSVGNGGNVQSVNGYDIAFANAALTKYLWWEIEQYTPTTGELIAWVKLPNVSSTVSETVFNLVYGDASIVTDISVPRRVWTNNYLGVYHLKDGTTLSVLDSLGNNNGTNTNGVTAGAGQVDGCGSFASASTQYIALGNGMNPLSVTLSAWVKATTFPNALNTPIGRVGSGSNYSALYVSNTGKLACFAFASNDRSYNGTGSHTLVTGTWYYLTMTYNSGAGLVGYVNAESDGTVAANGALVTTAANARIGSDPLTATREWNGLIDEPRIAGIARTANWITTEYNNQFSPGTFLTLGSETPGSITLAFLSTLVGHTTGYDSIADFGVANVELDGTAASKSSAISPTGLVPFIWPSFALTSGRYIDFGSAESPEMWGIVGG